MQRTIVDLHEGARVAYKALHTKQSFVSKQIEDLHESTSKSEVQFSELLTKRNFGYPMGVQSVAL